MNGLTDRGSISENAILVENLSKSYLLGHQAHKQRRSNYTALRDVIAREARNFVRKAGDMVHGRDREVLIVNNNCTDETDGIIEQFTDSLPVRLLHERWQGLSNARNCAVAGARGDYILWTYDDAIVDPNWGTLYERLRSSL